MRNQLEQILYEAFIAPRQTYKIIDLGNLSCIQGVQLLRNMERELTFLCRTLRDFINAAIINQKLHQNNVLFICILWEDQDFSHVAM